MFNNHTKYDIFIHLGEVLSHTPWICARIMFFQKIKDILNRYVSDKLLSGSLCSNTGGYKNVATKLNSYKSAFTMVGFTVI